MSTVKSKKLQVGTDASASNNFTIYQPATPDGTLRIGVGNADNPTEVAQFTSSGLVSGVSKLDTATGSAPSYSARAWVNFNGRDTVAIRESGNVSSITDNGTGIYTVNFTSAMPDANYSPTTALKPHSGGTSTNGKVVNIKYDVNLSTTSFTLWCNSTAGTEDFEIVSVAIFR